METPPKRPRKVSFKRDISCQPPTFVPVYDPSWCDSGFCAMDKKALNWLAGSVRQMRKRDCEREEVLKKTLAKTQFGADQLLKEVTDEMHNFMTQATNQLQAMTSDFETRKTAHPATSASTAAEASELQTRCAAVELKVDALKDEIRTVLVQVMPLMREEIFTPLQSRIAACFEHVDDRVGDLEASCKEQFHDCWHRFGEVAIKVYGERWPKEFFPHDTEAEFREQLSDGSSDSEPDSQMQDHQRYPFKCFREVKRDAAGKGKSTGKGKKTTKGKRGR